jgi:hypothetical protein
MISILDPGNRISWLRPSIYATKLTTLTDSDTNNIYIPQRSQVKDLKPILFSPLATSKD